MSMVLRRLADGFALLGGLILLAIVAVTTTNTFAFIFDRVAGIFGADVAGLPGYEDFVQLAISCAALMFFPYCQANRGHVSVELLMDRMPRTLQRAIDLLWLAVTVLVALFLAYWMVFGMLEVRSDQVVTSVLGWPTWPFYIPGLLSMILWALIAASQAFGDVADA
ncbi:TRAP transporter small permease [Ruegeria sp. EL01]|jgi:TRAP-type C4-dicarboxylate transport system permease small subunit|uniref:TRAP transporter small permease n=1 Tax=Ruegeria sp. EL01 TaxID=2107578 RepID=UPI000EA8091B|nr:TRAP transporter small permease [Ruegeria sp. EL01]